MDYYYELCYFRTRKDTGSIYVKTNLNKSEYITDDEFLDALVDQEKITIGEALSITEICKIDNITYKEMCGLELTWRDYIDNTNSPFQNLRSAVSINIKVSTNPIIKEFLETDPFLNEILDQDYNCSANLTPGKVYHITKIEKSNHSNILRFGLINDIGIEIMLPDWIFEPVNNTTK